MPNFRDRHVDIFVVWEPVLFTDWGPPSTSALRRIPERGVHQYWDRGRLLSHALGEGNRSGIVWDHVAVYAPGQDWTERLPTPIYEGGPVIDVTSPLRDALLRGSLQRSIAAPPPA